MNKRKGEEYQLFWPEDPDFVRLAAKLNALIIPFAAVGGDEAFDLALDSDEVLSHPIFGGLARSALSRIEPGLPLSEAVPPVTKLPGLGLPSLFPVANLSRLYFRSVSYHPSYLFYCSGRFIRISCQRQFLGMDKWCNPADGISVLIL